MALARARRCARRARAARAACRPRGRAASRISSRRGRVREEPEDALGGSGREGLAGGAGHGRVLLEQLLQEIARLAMLQHVADRAGASGRSRRRRRRASRTSPRSTVAMASVAEASRPGAREQAATSAAMPGSPPRPSTIMRCAPPGRADHSGRADGGADVDAASGDPLGRHVAGDHRPAVDAVLERDEPGAFADQRREARRRGFGVEELDREDHDVDGADRRWIVGGRDARQVRVPVRALDPQSARRGSR